MYSAQYEEKLVSSQKAAELVAENDMLVFGLNMAEPPALLSALAQRLASGDLKKLRAFSLLPLKHAMDTILAPQHADCVDVVTAFVSGGERGLVATGLNHFVPCHFHQVPRLLEEHIGVDVCMTMVSPMDSSGFMSLGTSNDCTSTAAREAGTLLVEVNQHMPRVFGDSAIHISEVTAVVENHQPLIELPMPPPKEEDAKIARTIAEMVPDGATLQLGIGNLPDFVARHLEGHKDLGIHTEVFGPGMARLIKKGVVNGSKKTLHPRKHVFTLALGDREMLDFMDDNPAMVSYPVSYVNHPSTIAQNANMISINSIIEVDLLGQCNSEFLAGHQFSGTGGQLDFVRGAYDSPGGKSILAFRSTAKGGAVSRVVPQLEHGAMITTPRMDVHWLVTEYGAVNLKGRSTKERAQGILSLAHPDFREELMRAAEDMYLI